MSSKIQYSRVNLMKFIGAFLVIAIHTNPLFDLSWGANFFVVNVLSRIAVPFYLVTSGFFLYPKMIDQMNPQYQKKNKAYIQKLIFLYMFWSAFYLLINLPAYFANKSFIVGLAHVGRNLLFTSIDVHLWYLIASAVAVFCIAVILRKGSWKVLMIVSTGLYILLLLTQTYSGLVSGTMIGTAIGMYERIFGTIATSFMMAIPFLTLGMAIRRYEWWKKFKYSGRCSLFTFGLICIEHFTMRFFMQPTDYAVSISVALFTVQFFIYLVQKDEQTQSALLVKYSEMFQQASLFVYIIHIAFLRLLLVIYNFIGIENPRLITFFLISIFSFGSYLCVKRMKVFYQYIMNPRFKLKRKPGM